MPGLLLGDPADAVARPRGARFHIATQFLQLTGEHGMVDLQHVEQALLLRGKLHGSAPAVDQIRETIHAHKAGSATVELTIGTVGLQNDITLPVPHAVVGSVVLGEPQFGRRHLGQRESGDIAHKEGQEAPCVYDTLHIFFRCYPHHTTYYNSLNLSASFNTGNDRRKASIRAKGRRAVATPALSEGQAAIG